MSREKEGGLRGLRFLELKTVSIAGPLQPTCRDAFSSCWLRNWGLGVAGMGRFISRHGSADIMPRTKWASGAAPGFPMRRAKIWGYEILVELGFWLGRSGMSTFGATGWPSRTRQAAGVLQPFFSPRSPDKAQSRPTQTSSTRLRRR